MFFKLLNSKPNFQKSFALFLLTIPLCIPDSLAHRGRRDDDAHTRSYLTRTRPVVVRDIRQTADARPSILRRRTVLVPTSTIDGVIPRRVVRISPRRPMRIIPNSPTVLAHRRICVRPVAPPVVVVPPPLPTPAIVARGPSRQGTIMRTQSELIPTPICRMPPTWPESTFAIRRVNPVAWPTSPIRVRRVMTNPDPWPVSSFTMLPTWPGRPMMIRRHWVPMASPSSQYLHPMPMAMSRWRPQRMAYCTY